MSDPDNFVYDSEGNLTEDKSKRLKISYDWRGMPIEFKQTAMPQGSTDNELYKLEMKYDGSGRRVSKTVWRKAVGAENWQKKQVTHYTGIGTEIRENYHNESLDKAKVVMNMPQGLGRYGIEDAKSPDMGFGAGYIPNVKFEWYLKNHLGSTMLVYGTEGNATSDPFTLGTPLAAYDYRAFGEQLTLLPAGDKFTENFTGKERDDEIALNYFGARYLDPMLGLWISVDPKRQFASPYLYAGNGYNPVNVVDPDGNEVDIGTSIAMNDIIEPAKQAIFEKSLDVGLVLMAASAAFDIGALTMAAAVTAGPEIVAAGASAARNAAVGARAMFAAGASRTIGFAQEFMSCPQCVIGTMMTATSKVYPIRIPVINKRWNVGPISFYGIMDFAGGLISGAGPVYGRAERAGSVVKEFVSGVAGWVRDEYHKFKGE